MNSLPKIKLKTLKHRGALQLFLLFSYNNTLISLVKDKLLARWSFRYKAWYIPYSLENENKIILLFKEKAIIDNSDLKKTTHFRKIKVTLSEKRKDFYIKYKNYLIGKRYSQSTVETYSSFVYNFLGFVQNIPLQGITNSTIERYFESDFIKKEYSISTQRQFISAIKLLAKFYPHTQISEVTLERPIRDKKLPNVLSKEEIISIIRCTKNIKHKVIITLIYSSGLRISELLNLELHHFDIGRNQLIIKNSKGRKDRFVVLAKSILPLLQTYIESYKPKKYFVEGPKGKYSSSSIRKFLERSCLLAKVYKKVTPHTLRHSYATHLLENGTGIRYIQELLGHSKLETTMIYTHVAQKDLLEIESPLDNLLKNLNNSNPIKKFSLSSRF